MLRTRTFLLEKGSQLESIQAFLDEDIGRQGDLIQDISVTPLNDETYQLVITYRPNQFSPTVLHAPPRGAVISTSGAPDWALSVFSEPIDATTISGNVYADGTGVPSKLEYDVLLKVQLTGLGYSDLGYHSFKYTTGILDQDRVPISYETHWGYVVSDKAAVFYGYAEPYTKYERRGPVKIAKIPLPKGVNTDSKVREYLSLTEGIPEYRFIALAVARRVSGLAEAFLIYFTALEPQPIETFPNVDAVLPNTEAPDKVVITFLEPLDSAKLQQSGIFRLDSGYDSTYDLEPDRLALSPDGCTLEVSTSGLFDSAGMQALLLLPGLAPAFNPTVTLTRPLVFPFIFDPLPGASGSSTGTVNIDPSGGLENGPSGLRLLTGAGWYIPGPGSGLTPRPSGALKFSSDQAYLYVDVDNTTIKVDPSGYLYSTATGESGYIPGSGFTVDSENRFHVGTTDSTINVGPNYVQVWDVGGLLSGAYPVTLSNNGSSPPVYIFGVDTASPITGGSSGLTLIPSGVDPSYLVPGTDHTVLKTSPTVGWGTVDLEDLSYTPLTGLAGESGVQIDGTAPYPTAYINWGTNFQGTDPVNIYVSGTSGNIVTIDGSNQLTSDGTKISDLSPTGHTHTSADITDFDSAATGAVGGAVDNSSYGAGVIWDSVKIQTQTYAFTGLTDTPSGYSSGHIVTSAATGIEYIEPGTGISTDGTIHVKIDGVTLQADSSGVLYSTPSGSGLAAGSGLVSDATSMHVVAGDSSIYVAPDSISVYTGLWGSGLTYESEQVHVAPDNTTLELKADGTLGVIDDIYAAYSHTHPHTDITDFTEAAQDAVGGILIGTNTLSLVYNDGAPSIYGSVQYESSPTIDLSDSPAGLRADVVTGDVLTGVNSDQVDGKDVSSSTTPGDYLWAATTIQSWADASYAPLAGYTGHTGDSSIHYTKASIQLSELGNVAAGEASGDTLVFDGANWQPNHTTYATKSYVDSTFAIEADFTGHTGDSSVHFQKNEIALGDLQDVSNVLPNTDDILVFNGSSWAPNGSTYYTAAECDSTFTPISTFSSHTGDSSIHFTELDGLSDVSLSSPASGEVLTYDGSQWVNEPYNGASTLSSLEIDADKNWSGHAISGLGTLTPETSSAALGSESKRWDVYGDSLSLGGSLTLSTKSVSSSWTTDGTSTVLFVDTSSAPVTITLGSADAVAGRVIYVKDSNGQASTNNISISDEGGGSIDGSSSYTIDSDYGFVQLCYDGSSNWFILSESSSTASAV